MSVILLVWVKSSLFLWFGKIDSLFYRCLRNLQCHFFVVEIRGITQFLVRVEEKHLHVRIPGVPPWVGGLDSNQCTIKLETAVLCGFHVLYKRKRHFQDHFQRLNKSNQIFSAKEDKFRMTMFHPHGDHSICY